MPEERTDLLKTIDENPEAIAGFNREQVEQATAEFASLIADDDVDLTGEELDAIMAHTEALQRRVAELDEADQTRAEKLAAARANLGITDTEDPDTEEPEAVDEPAEDSDSDPEPEPVEESEPVTASAKPALGALSKRIPADRKPRQTPPALIASAGEREGQRFGSRQEFGAYMERAWKAAGKDMKAYVASLDVRERRTAGGGLSLSDSAKHNGAVLAEVAQRAQADGNLVASGGFCAPAEVVYDFFNIATRSGLVTLPTVNAPRGRVQYPVSPTLGDFLGQAGIGGPVWDNSTDTNPGETTKAVFTVDCPDTQTCEVAAYPTILQFGNFAARFYPENVANATALAMIAAARRINTAAIAALTGAATVVTAAGSTLTGGGIVNLYQILAAQAAEYRQVYGMGLDAALDLIVPHWLDDALAADAVARDSTVEYQDVVRRVRGIFAELNLRVQYVYDYQNLADGFFPETVDVLLMAPGTAVQLDAGELDLGVVRDSTLNATNDYQTFTESFVGWCFPGHEVREIEAIPVCPTGGTGDRVTIACATSS